MDQIMEPTETDLVVESTETNMFVRDVFHT